jgi:transcriptional regulator with XRE-family HTH domain
VSEVSESRAFVKLGEALRWLRDRRGLSQADLAQRASLTPSSLSRYESGRAMPSLERLQRLLEALDADVLQLGLALLVCQGMTTTLLDLPAGLSDRERSALTVSALAFHEFVETVAARLDALPAVGVKPADGRGTRDRPAPA